MNQVPCTVLREGGCNQNAVHFNSEGQQTMKTLHVGNFEYNSESKSLHKALQKYFRYMIKVDKVESPEQNDKPLGYAFVILSWTKAAK